MAQGSRADQAAKVTKKDKDAGATSANGCRVMRQPPMSVHQANRY